MQDAIETAVAEAGYAGLAAVMAIETVFPPIPSELVLPLAGFQVARGTLGFVPAGLSEMPLWRFVAATTAGALVWNAALPGAGALLGAQYDRVENYVGPVSTAVMVTVVLAVIAGMIWLRRR